MFAFKYLETYNHREAAEAVGRSASQGLTYLRRPMISKLVAHLQEELQTRSIVDKQFVEAKWLEVLPKLMGEEEVDLVDTKNGVTFKGKKFHSNEMVAALKELGKTSGYSEGKGGAGGVNINIDFGALGLKQAPVYAERADD